MDIGSKQKKESELLVRPVAGLATNYHQLVGKWQQREGADGEERREHVSIWRRFLILLPIKGHLLSSLCPLSL